MKVLLLNPPGERLYLRDYYCSQVSKANYLPPPIDLLIQSGILSEKHDITVIDAIASRMTEKECLSFVRGENFDAVVFLTSFLSWKEDSNFMKKVKESAGIKIIGSGDILYFEKKHILEKYDFLDAVLTDFCSDGVLKFLFGNDSPSIAVKNRNDKSGGQGNQKTVSYQTPRHDLFPVKKYRWPFSRYHPMSTLLTAYGCPFRCSFCSYEKFPFALRPAAEVMNEIEYILSLGIKELYIKDLTFAAVKDHSIGICEEIISRNLSVSWSCFSRVDVIDEELIAVMKRAGCHTIMFGIESASDNTLAEYKKGVTKEKIKKAFNLCGKHGISTLGTFILGLPGETEQNIHDTVDFAVSLGCDYASFNLAEAAPGSSLRDVAIWEGLIKPDPCCEGSYGFEVPESDGLSIYDKMKLVRYAERKFYLRPGYLIKRVAALKSMHQFKNGLSQAAGLIFRK